MSDQEPLTRIQKTRQSLVLAALPLLAKRSTHKTLHVIESLLTPCSQGSRDQWLVIDKALDVIPDLMLCSHRNNGYPGGNVQELFQKISNKTGVNIANLLEIAGNTFRGTTVIVSDYDHATLAGYPAVFVAFRKPRDVPRFSDEFIRLATAEQMIGKSNVHGEPRRERYETFVLSALEVFAQPLQPYLADVVRQRVVQAMLTNNHQPLQNVA
jgi:hypothetical protein